MQPLLIDLFSNREQQRFEQHFGEQRHAVFSQTHMVSGQFLGGRSLQKRWHMYRGLCMPPEERDGFIARATTRQPCGYTAC